MSSDNSFSPTGTIHDGCSWPVTWYYGWEGILFNALMFTLKTGLGFHLSCLPPPLVATQEHKISQLPTSHVDLYIFKLF